MQPLFKFRWHFFAEIEKNLHKAIKVQEKNIRQNSLTLVLAMIFCTWHQNIDNKSKNKWDYIKLKFFFTAQEIINEMKTQPTGWKKTFANHMSDKGLISKIHKELI